jgi:hypothetical protein
MLVHGTFAVRVSLATATFNLGIRAKISAVIFETYVTCFFQVAASARTVIFLTAFLSLKSAGTTTF